MRTIIFSFVFLLPAVLFGQTYRKHTLRTDRLSIELSEGVLNLIPLTDKAIRVQWEKNGMKESQELVLIHKQASPKFKLSETSTQIKLSTSAVSVLFTKKTTALDFLDKAGNVFLSEKAGGRKLSPNAVLDQACFICRTELLVA
jgi:alpha-D-xyloside xylohydrolase